MMTTRKLSYSEWSARQRHSSAVSVRKGIFVMAKKSTKIALTYFITIFVTLLIIGGICVVLLRDVMDPDTSGGTVINIEQMTAGGYVPTVNDNKTTLFIFDSEKRMTGTCFMIVRMLSTKRELVLIPVPADTYSKVDGTENSIYEFYRTGGSAKAVKAVESALDVDVDYYLKLNNESFADLVSIFGGVSFTVPYNLIYTDPNTGEETIIREGDTYLDFNGLRKVITFPAYNSGEEYRAKMMGIAFTDLINKNIVSGFSNNIDDYFSQVINSTVETNFTAYDYKELSDAMKYVAESPDRIATLVAVSGAYDENGLFVLDDSFIKVVPEWLGLDLEDEGPVPGTTATTSFEFPE